MKTTHTPRSGLILMICALSLSALSLSALTLTGCTPRIYRMDIQQGNALTPDLTCKIRKGMSKDQVQDVLGSPMLKHSVETNRWDYYYSFNPGRGGEPKEQHFTVYFKNGRVDHWEES